MQPRGFSSTVISVTGKGIRAIALYVVKSFMLEIHGEPSRKYVDEGEVFKRDNHDIDSELLNIN